MTRSGWTGPRRWCWRLWRGGCWPSRSRWCSPRMSRVRSCGGCRSWRSVGWVRVMRGSCSARCSGCRWMSGCGTASWRRRGAIRWRCLSCREVCPVCRGCRNCRGCRGGSRRVSGGGWRCLPAATRRLMLVAAAEPAGGPALVWRAAERLGIGAEAAWPAADAGLLTIGERVTFRHPLVRSAVYRAARGAGPAGRAPGAGRRDRSAGRPRSAGLAPRAGDAGTR